MRSLILATGVLALSFGPFAKAEDFAERYQKDVKGVVFITAIDQDWEYHYGSGVVLDEKLGLVLSAYHVVGTNRLILAHHPEFDDSGKLVSNADRYLESDDENECVVVARDQKRDLALLKFKKPCSQLKSIPLAARSARPGQIVYTIGSDAEKSMFHFASGNVRGIHADKHTFPSGQEIEAAVIETTVPTNGGDSGGPLLNSNGEIVGINSSSVPGADLVHKGIELSEVSAFVAEARQITRQEVTIDGRWQAARSAWPTRS